MSFLSPLFLAGAIAAAIPIVLHLLRREPEPKVAFAAVRLLRHAPVEHTSRRRLREWLLLALRIAALVLLAVAFARPFFAGGAAAGPSHATIVAVDTSLSLSSPAAAAHARDLAVQAVNDAPSGDLVGLVTFDDEAAVVEPPTADRARVRSAIGAIVPGDAATRYRAAIGAASRALDGRPGTIVVITDMQAGGWAAGEAAGVPAGVDVDVRDTGEPPANLAVVAAAHDTAQLTATIRNTSAEARDAHVRVSLDDADAGATTVHVPAHGEAPAVFETPGDHATAAVRVDDPDGIQGDNVRYLVLGGASRPRVTIVSANGTPARDAVYVQQALAAAPEGTASPFAVAGVAADALGDGEASPIADAGAVLLLSTRGLEPRGRERLTEFVRGGGGLFVAAGPDVDGEVVAGVLAGAGQIAIGDPHGGYVGRTFRSVDGARALAATDPRHPVFQPFAGNPSAFGAAVFDGVVALEADGCRTIARFTTGEAGLVDCADGDGRALLFASDLDGAWNDLPKRAAFVPFLRASIRYLAARRQAAASVTIAGRPAGTPPVPGIVEAADGRGGSHRVAVNVDPRESDPTQLSRDEFLAPIAVAGSSEPGAAPEAAAARPEREAEERQRLWQYALGLALAVLVAESAVATRTA